MILGVVLARLLTPDDFGRFAYTSAVVTALMIPFWITVTPLLVTDGNRNPSLFGNVLGFMCITSVLKTLMLCCYMFFQLMAGQPEQALLAFLIGAPVAFFDVPETLRADLEGRGRFGPNLATQLASLATNAAVSIGLVLIGWGVYGLAVGGFAAYWPQLVLYLVTGRRKMSEARFKAADLLSLAKIGLSFWTMQFSTHMSARIDKIFLGKLGGDTQLGYYNRAFNYGPFCLFLLGSLLTNASVVAMRQQPSMRAKLAIFRKTSLLLFAGGMLNWAVLWWLSDPIVPWLFGEQWRGAIPAFQAFSWLGLAMAVHYSPMNFLLANEANVRVALGKAAGLLITTAGLAIVWIMDAVTAQAVAYPLCIGIAAAGGIMILLSVPIISAGVRDAPQS